MKNSALLLLTLPIIGCTGHIARSDGGDPQTIPGERYLSEVTAFEPVRTVRPVNPRKYAEVSLGAVEVWEIAGERGGIAITDYVSVGSPLWVIPGEYELRYGCPGETHTYETVQTINFEHPSQYVLSCANNTLLLHAGKSN